MARAKSQPANVILASILWVDIVGYSKLNVEQSARVIKQLETSLKACPSFKSAHGAGELVELPSGDGFGLIFLKNPALPFKCAIELQSAIAGKFDFEVRMGINVGPIELRKNNLSELVDANGDGANMASRIMNLAKPGEILVTQSAFEIGRHLAGIQDQLEPAGAHTIKHGDQVTAYRLTVGASQAQPKTWFQVKEESVAKSMRERDSARGLEVATVKVIASRLAAIRRDALLGLTVLLLGLFLGDLLEHSRIGHDARQWAYERLQGNLAAPRSLPVAVIDIGRSLDKDDVGTTDLIALKGILDAVEKQGPAVVAIDIDFGFLPKAQTWLDTNEVVVGSAYAYTQQGKPVFLAVRRQLYRQDPQQWLGDEKYAKMVVHPFFSDEVITLSPTTLATELELGKYRIPSLVAGLVSKQGANLPGSLELPQALREVVTPYAKEESEQENINFGEPSDQLLQPVTVLKKRFFLNFSALNKIKEQTIRVKSGEDLLSHPMRSELAGAMVIIGSVDDERDAWYRPDTGTKESGVYLHAVGAFTLAQAPLYELVPSARIMLNFLILASVLGSVLFVRLRYLTSPSNVARGNVSLTFTLIVAAMTYMLGIWLIRTFHIMWTDFLLSAVLVLFHPKFEHELVRLCTWLKSRTNQLWKSIVLSSESKLQ